MHRYGISPALLLVLVVATVHRFSRLITRDSILDGPRDWIIARYHGSLVELLSCMWCVSVWVAAAVLSVVVFGPAWFGWVMFGAAASSVAGLLGGWE